MFEQIQDKNVSFRELEIKAREHIQGKYIGTFWQRNLGIFIGIAVFLLLITPFSVYYDDNNDDFIGIVYFGSFAINYLAVGITLLYFAIIGLITFFRQRSYLPTYKKVAKIIIIFTFYIFVMYYAFLFLDFAYETIINIIDADYSIPTNYDYIQFQNILNSSALISACITFTIMVVLFLCKQVLISFGALPESIKGLELTKKIAIRSARGAMELYAHDSIRIYTQNNVNSIDKLITKFYLLLKRVKELTDQSRHNMSQQSSVTQNYYEQEAKDLANLQYDCKLAIERIESLRKDVEGSAAKLYERLRKTRRIGFDLKFVSTIKFFIGFEQLSKADEVLLAKAIGDILDSAAKLNETLTGCIKQADEILANNEIKKANTGQLVELEEALEKSLDLPIPKD